MKEIKELSNCCKSEVKIGGDDKEVTHYYICTKCNKPCDLYSEIIILPVRNNFINR